MLIREYDYLKIISNDWGGIVFDGMMLYNRSSFDPLTRAAIEKEIIWEKLTSSSKKIWQHHDSVHKILDGMKDWLYNARYADWKVSWDDDDYLCVQARSNTPRSRLGWAVFEYDR